MTSRSQVRFSAPTALLLVVFVLSLPVVTTRFYASDEIEYFSWLRSAVFDHDAKFTNEYQFFYDAGVIRDTGFHQTFLEDVNEAGNAPNFAPIGTALLWSPFYLAGHFAALATGAPANGMSPPYIASVTYGSACYAMLAVALSVAIVHRVLPKAWPSAIAIWIGTPLLFYTYVAPGFSHACSAFAVSLFLWIWLRVRSRWTWQGAAALGAAGALMAMVREQDVFFIAGPAIDWLRATMTGASHAPTDGAASRERGSLRLDGTSSVVRRRDSVLAALAGAAAFLIAYVPQLLAYQALNGHFGPTDKVARKMNWMAPHFFQVLFSPEHGLFFWTPIACIAIAGLLLLATDRVPGVRADARWIATLALLMLALQVYVSGSVESWTVAGSFGQRRFVGTTPLLSLGLASIAAAAASRRIMWRTLAVLTMVCIWWNLGLMAQFGLHTMNRQALSPAQNARATFLQLPLQAPAILWRYLTDRSSFFGEPQR